MYERFDHNTHWISHHVQNGLFGVSNPMIVDTLKFAALWDLIAISYTILHWTSISTTFPYVSVLGLFWVNIPPYLI